MQIMVANEPDATCERFLRAREWSLPKATKMVRKFPCSTHVDTKMGTTLGATVQLPSLCLDNNKAKRY